ncbi:hypothetical protein E2C01_054437 [Portunus trituberculatus]|uniref:HTH psq-type domain-containing protein n=1 Tax=Portunus trituberculatus TaxID=210409 RepID=A0A5B7GS19_PORTR|nr:hypothetical protein [Portunus trituberculatus]
MLSWYSGDNNMLEPFKMEEDPDGTSQQVAVIMTGKRPAMSPSVAKKTRKSLTLEVKLDIIRRHERGEKTNSIASHHGLTPSTVYHFQVGRLY